MNYYPMQVNPFNFTKGDVVKKVIAGGLITPYVGVVTAIAPAANKVEVQWPTGASSEDPSDLIKVNPWIDPPVVTEDKSYSTFQNQLSKDYYDKIQPRDILQDFTQNMMSPVIFRAACLYNGSFSKTQAFNILNSEVDSSDLVKTALDSVYNDSVNASFVKEINVNNHKVKAEVKIIGDSNSGFIVESVIGSDKKTEKFDKIQEAVSKFNSYKKIIDGIKKETSTDVIAKVAKDYFKESGIDDSQLKSLVRNELSDKLKEVNDVEGLLVELKDSPVEVKETFESLKENEDKQLGMLEELLEMLDKDYEKEGE